MSILRAGKDVHVSACLYTHAHTNTHSLTHTHTS